MAWVLIRAVFLSRQSRFLVLPVQMDLARGEVCSSTPSTLSTAAFSILQHGCGALLPG